MKSQKQWRSQEFALGEGDHTGDMGPQKEG